VKSYVDRNYPGRDLTAQQFPEFRERIRLMSAICLFTGAFLFGYRRRIPPLYARLVADRTRFRRQLSQGWYSLVHDPWAFWPFLAVFLFGFILRALDLFRGVRFDEAYTYINYARAPLYRALSDYSFPNNHLFHTFLVFLSTRLLGNTLLALIRLWSAAS
jgi:hypothetical protein